MKNKYKIGEVSKILGVSTDTLRLYEKKNIVIPSKDIENKYRYYSIYDIYNLIGSIFYRRINISLDDISELMWNSTYEQTKEIILNKGKEIENEIKKQNIYLKKINKLKESFTLIENHLDKISIRPLNKVFILCELEPNNIKSLLELNKENFDLYNFSSKVYIKNNNIENFIHYLTIEEENIKDFNLKDVLKPKEYLEYDKCIYTILKTDIDNIDINHIKHIQNYIKINNINTHNFIFINSLLWVVENQKQLEYMEMFVPII